MRSIKFVAGVCLLALVAFSMYAVWSGSTPLVSLVLGAYVLGMGWLVASYSARNLYGQPRLGRFAALLALAIGALWVLVVAQPIWLTALAWTVSGLAVAGLVAHASTKRARAAAWRVARTLLVGDLALWTAVAIMASQGLNTRADLADAGWMVPALLLIAGVVRSALFPAWRWLPLTAEAPSPVSALLHAGVVNGTGLLAMLWWPLFAGAPAVLVAFVGIGLVSAVLGTAAMRARPDVKGRLASSTSAQMGYMTVQIGLGLPAFAMLHLIGHGFYKAWLFLRAGGAPGRPEFAAPRDVSKAGVALLAVPTALGIAAATLTWSGVPVVDLVPLAVAGAAALAALVALAFPGRTLRVLSSRASRIAAIVTVIAGLAGYVIVLGIWSRVFGVASAFEGAPAIALTVTVLAFGGFGLYAAGRDWLRPLVRSAVIDPRVRGRVARLEVESPHSARPAVDAVSGLVGPMWPIRSAVAVNPLHGMQSLPFGDAAQIAERTWRARSYLTEDLYVQALQAGRFTADDLVAASEGLVLPAQQVAEYLQARVGWEPSAAARVAAERVLLDVTALTGSGPESPTLGDLAGVADRVSGLANGWTALVIAEPSPWVAFQQQVRDNGLRGLREAVRGLPADPDLAIGALLADRVRQDVAVGYLAALTARDPGWVAHVQQRNPELLSDLLAIRVAFDVLVAGSRGVHEWRPAQGPDPREQLIGELEAVVDILGIRNPRLALEVATSLGQRQRCAIWQRAWESRYANRLIDRATTRAQQVAETERSDVQVVMCIDVRSERMRRHLEAAGPIATYGYAGFFGLAIRYENATGRVTDQCPVLIAPQHDVHDLPPRPRGGYAQALRAALISATRLPGASFAVAEGLGVLAGSDAWAQTAAPGTWGRGRDRLLTVERGTLESAMDAQAGAAAVAAMLRAIGLVGNFAPVILVTGHAATVENNAFAAAYDCGACGGNGGYVNARLMAQLANNPAVRAELLREHGIKLPPATVVLAAWHNTTTDEIVIDDADVPVSHAQAVGQLRARLARAREGVLAERMAELPLGSPSVSAAYRRASDWAQPQPEFGLAGNAAFVIGPRSITKGLNLRGRVFLHSYEPGLDVDGSILETLLTAPMVVTQWINNQYYFATVDPERFGAGDKTTHNVVGDYAVFTGAGGDLRVGLPWQSTYRCAPGGSLDDLQHEPLRLQVLVYAEPADIDRVLADHPEVAALLVNEWIFLAAIDPRTGQAQALDARLTWRDWLVEEPAHVMEG